MKRKRLLITFIVVLAMLLNISMATTYYAYDTWSVQDTNYPGAPSYAGCETDQCDMIYSTYGIKFSLLSISNTQSGAYGDVTIRVLNSNATMTSIKLNNTNTVATAKPVFVGAIPGASFSLTPFTLFSGNRYTAGGNAHTLN